MRLDRQLLLILVTERETYAHTTSDMTMYTSRERERNKVAYRSCHAMMF